MGRIIQIEAGKTTEYLTGVDLNTVTPVADTYFIGVDSLTGTYRKLNPDGSIVDLESGSVNTTTYADLVSLISTNSLVPGTYYNISDFETIYDQPDYFIDGNVKTSVITKTSSTKNIVVLATSVNDIDVRAYQPNSKNQIKYDINFNSTEIMGSPAKGRIIELIDQYNNRTGYDHETVEFKRYQTYDKAVGVLTGYIADYDCTTGYVNGSGTLFSTEISVGDILIFDTKSVFGYDVGVKVVNIIDDTTLNVYVDLNYSGTVFSGQNFLFNKGANTGNYVSYKEVYVDQSNQGDYTENPTFQGNSTNNYIGDIDPSIGYPFKTDNNFFDTNCSYNQITYGFNNTLGSSFYINKIGAYFANNIIFLSCSNNLIGDDFVNNTILDNFYHNKIGNVFDNNKIYNDFSLNEIGNYCSSNFLGSNTTGNKIGDYFGNGISNKIGFTTTITYNTSSAPVNNLNITNPGTGYVTSSGLATVGGSGSGLIVDIVDDGSGGVASVSINSPGTYYQIGDSVTISAGGNDCTLDVTGLNPFTIGDTIDDGFGGTAEIVTNTVLGISGDSGSMTVQVVLGNLLPNDNVDNGNDTTATITDLYLTDLNNGMKDNVIGNYFLGNTIGEGFERNVIGNYFGNDQSTGLSNIILDNFKDNTIGSYFGIDVQTPDTGNGGNLIRSNFIGNTISTDFTYNVTFDTGGGGYYNNKIGYGCNNNVFGDGFNYNELGDLFQSNTIDAYFGGNQIGYFFNTNTIGSNFADNVIGDVSWFNTFGTNCLSNKTNSMFANDITNGEFSGNIVGENFGLFFVGGNTIDTNCYDNVFGNFCYGNTIGTSCESNNFFNYFVGNTVGNGFTMNILQYPVQSVDFTANPATHVYNNYTCVIFGNASATLRLSYYDSFDTLTITDPDL